MSPALRAALTAGPAVGAVAGVIEGAGTLARHAYLPRFALFSFAAPVVLTTVFLVGCALVLAGFAAWRRSPRAALAEELAVLLATVVALLWIAEWWRALAAGLFRSGIGYGLALLALVPLFGATMAAGLALARRVSFPPSVWRQRWLVRMALAGAAFNAVLVWPLGHTVLREMRGSFIDTSAGPRRGAGEINVVLVTIDTLRADRLAAFGGRPDLTPHLNALAEDAVVFTSAISQSSWTLPAVASLMTGLNPSGHGAGCSTNAFDLLARTPIATEVPVLADGLRRCGYLTQAIVTNPYLSMSYGFGRGFDRFDNITMESEAGLILRDSWAGRIVVWLWPRLRAGDIGETVTDRAERWLARHRDERFFLWLHYIDPHAPYGDPARLGSKSFRGDLLIAGSDAIVPRDGAALEDRFAEIARLRAGEIRLDASQRVQLQNLYDAGVRYADLQIGRLLLALKQHRVLDHTLVVITSDHGEEFWDHAGVEHGHTLYDELIRVPLIIRHPAGPRGMEVADVVRLIDVSPTVLDLAGCPYSPEAMHGRTLRPLLAGQSEPPRTALSENLLFADDRQALRTKDFKYIVWSNGKEELYDLDADPREQRDLAAIEELVGPKRLAFAAQRPSRPEPRKERPAEVDEATRELLRRLGYGN